MEVGPSRFIALLKVDRRFCQGHGTLGYLETPLKTLALFHDYSWARLRRCFRSHDAPRQNTIEKMRTAQFHQINWSHPAQGEESPVAESTLMVSNSGCSCCPIVSGESSVKSNWSV